MGKFLELEKPRQAQFKATSPYFSEAARAPGLYKTKLRPHCVPQALSIENLSPEIREPMMDYFTSHQIKWHDALDKRPSNHLCDSQVCCANFLYSFADKPHALVELLRPLFPTIQRVLPMEKSEPRPLVSFEWIGLKNYLEEKAAPNRIRSRGALFTSADAAVMFEHDNGSQQIVLIEWKYTESYSSTFYGAGSSGKVRKEIYGRFYEASDSPINGDSLPEREFDCLFYEPFYQLLRQQLLANEMEKAKELGAQIVSVLHIAPAHNTDFLRVTSPALLPLGKSPTEIWTELVRQSDRFRSITTEELFGRFPANKFPELGGWWKYITERYSWLQQGGDRA